MPRRRAKLIAWTLSLGFHAALGLLLIRDDAGQVRTLPQMESATRDDAGSEESSFTMALERTADSASAKSIAIAPPTGRRPVDPHRPTAHPPALMNLVSELSNRPAGRVDVQDVAPIEFRTPVAEPQPAIGTGAPMTKPAAVAQSNFAGRAGVPPVLLHGALPGGKSVVYILDRSTSMGLTRETFDAARAALLASVQALPADCRFQVIAYNGRVTRLFPGQDLLKPSGEWLERLGTALLELTPEGDSHHGVALRAALAIGADHLVFITDAGEEELAALRPILKGSAKPVAVSIVRVEAGKVSAAESFR